MTEPSMAMSATSTRLVQILDHYLADLQAGRLPDKSSLLAQYPELSADLEACLASLEFIRHAGLGSITGGPDYSLLGPAHAEAPGDEPQPACGVLGDYQLLRELGRGGMGVVYEAEQISLGRRVALKVLPFASALDPRQLRRFKMESQAAAQLHHTNIVPVHAVGCERGVHYYAMQYIEGQTLAAVISELRRREGLESTRFPSHPTGNASPAFSAAAETVDALGALATERSSRGGSFYRTVARLGVEAADALEHAHDQGIIHRDIKPANLLLDTDGRLWITDFGLARLQRDTGLTITGDLVGTLRYMSPEQALGRTVAVDQRTDVYSLGITLYELLTLRPAFAGRDRQALLRQIGFEEPRRPRAWEKAIPPELETIVLKAMAKDIESRYATARDLAEDLRRFLEDRPIRARRPSLARRATKWMHRHKPLVGAGIALLLMAVAGLAASTLMIWREQKRTEAQRQQAQENLRQARQAAQRARRAAADAKEQQQIALELLSRSQLDRGVRLLEEGNSLGLLDLVQARTTAEHIPCVRDAVSFLWAGWHEDHAGRLVQVVGHDGPVVAVAFSPDGKWFATASEDCTARVWVTANGLPLKPPLRHRAGVLAVAFSPDGKLLATGSRDGTARLWDVATGEPHGPALRYGHCAVNSVTFSADGKLLVIAAVGVGPQGEWVTTAPGIAQVWDPAIGELHGPPIQYRGELNDLAVSADGKLLATAHAGTVRLWDLSTGQLHGQPLRHPSTVELLAFSSDGKLLASARAGSVQLWNTATGLPHGPLIRLKRWALDLKFSPDGKLLATASMDWTVRLWDTATAFPRGRPLEHKGPVKAIAFSRDGKMLASGSWDATARLWDAETGEPLCPSFQHQGKIHAVAFSPDGKLLATASQDGTARLWATGAQARGKLLPGQRIVNAVAFSPDSKLLATAADGGTARLWRVASGQAHGQPLQHRDDVTAAAFSPDGKLLATASDDGITQFWDPTSGRARGRPLRQRPGLQALAFSPDGKLLVTGSEHGLLQFWNLATGQPQGKPFGKQDGLKALAWSPDGKLLAAGAWSSAWLWDAATGQAQGQPLRHGSTVRGLAFSPNGKRLAVGSEDGITQLWDLSTKRPSGPPLRNPAAVWGVALSPDGRWLAAGLADNTVRLWDPSAGAPRQSFRLRHGRPDSGPVKAVAFSPDGKLLASGSDDGTARVWHLPKEPRSLREMQLRTWVAMGARQGANGEVEGIPWQEWRELHQELGSLLEEQEIAAKEAAASNDAPKKQQSAGRQQ